MGTQPKRQHLGYLVMLDTPSPENIVEFDLYSVDMVKFVSDSKKIHAKHVLFSSCSGTVLNSYTLPYYGSD